MWAVSAQAPRPNTPNHVIWTAAQWAILLMPPLSLYRPAAAFALAPGLALVAAATRFPSLHPGPLPERHPATSSRTRSTTGASSSPAGTFPQASRVSPESYVRAMRMISGLNRSGESGGGRREEGAEEGGEAAGGDPVGQLRAMLGRLGSMDAVLEDMERSLAAAEEPSGREGSDGTGEFDGRPSPGSAAAWPLRSLRNPGPGIAAALHVGHPRGSSGQGRGRGRGQGRGTAEGGGASVPTRSGSLGGRGGHGTAISRAAGAEMGRVRGSMGRQTSGGLDAWREGAGRGGVLRASAGDPGRPLRGRGAGTDESDGESDGSSSGSGGSSGWLSGSDVEGALLQFLGFRSDSRRRRRRGRSGSGSGSESGSGSGSDSESESATESESHSGSGSVSGSGEEEI